MALRPAVKELSQLQPALGLPWLRKIDQHIASKKSQKTANGLGKKQNTLMRLTESLGDNSEFPLWQRHHNYDPLGLFRWGITPATAILEYLNNPKELFAQENLEPFSERIVTDNTFGFKFYSQLVNQKQPNKLISSKRFESVHKKELVQIQALEKMFLSHLKRSPGIYVIKQNTGMDKEIVSEIHQALLKWNSNHILLVVSDDQTDQNDTIIRQISDRLFIGHLDGFAPIQIQVNLMIKAGKPYFPLCQRNRLLMTC